MRKVAIIGATSSIAEHCARLLVTTAIDLTLVGRDDKRLERVACDLRVRSPQSTIRSMTADFLDPVAVSTTIAAIWNASGGCDAVLIAHGVLPDQKSCEGSPSNVAEALRINAISPVLFAEACVRHMLEAGSGTLAVIGSVAGDRGRRSNYVYGSAKALIERYLEGLRHRLANTRIRVVLIKPGPTDSPMTAHLKAAGAKLADPCVVARDIVRGMQQGKAVVYTPARWRVIMFVIRNLPARLFNKLDI